MTVANHVTRSPPSAISSRLSQTIRHHVPSQRHTPNCMISLSIMPLYPATSRHIPVYQSICPPTGEVTTGQEVVVHTAARVHVMQDFAVDPLAEFRRVNVEGTVNLARQSAASGVKRFIFISSIKVNGEFTQ